MKAYLEPKVDHTFHADSYVYGPGKNAHEAIRGVIIGLLANIYLYFTFDK
ncbi:MAG: hypothetical protein AAF600_18820 [Bacteroidota bacterium]